MKIIWPVQQRSGSEFAVDLTGRFLGDSLRPQVAFTPGRKEALLGLCPDLRQFAGSPWQFFEYHGIASAKIEAPGQDHLVLDLAFRFPQCKFIGTSRDIAKIINSHAKLGWHDEEKVLKIFTDTLYIYETLSRMHNLFLIPIDQPKLFNSTRFGAFLETETNVEHKRIINQWLPRNIFEYQKERCQFGNRQKVPNIDSLRSRRPWIVDYEHRYLELVKKTNGN